MADKLTKWMSFFQRAPVCWIFNLISFFLVIMICSVAYQFFLSFSDQPAEDRQSDELSVPSTPPVDVASIKKWHLFGQAAIGDDASSLPDTSLNLVLQGVFQADDPQQSYVAIIGTDGAEKIYHIGDKLPGGAQIEEILPDAVVLSIAGEREKLTLPRQGIDFAPPPRGFSP